ncbi:peroxiredoxin Q/BCP [Nitrosomonas marina]|uniref:thioredoxin-dependent peroxiredoxin n=1 Tax=Nitrosomonas marina TaxID=917 RepID=A0A1I0DYX9_9PROT|nr:peroxiredoxin [Nitrosomonas marina]SET37770.1 peroxiredoxin Q/BCP [Nitrosomonas marina]
MEWLIVVVFLALLGLAGWLLKPANKCELLKPGQAAPEFELTDQYGNTQRLVDFRGKWLVLYFYPRDDTPGCTRQACAFRDNFNKLKTLEVEVVGVSVDTVSSHDRFANKFGLNFSLLADTTAETAARYCSLLNLGIVKFAKRNTFLIDPFGNIVKVYWSVQASQNAGEIVSDLKHLKQLAHVEA